MTRRELVTDVRDWYFWDSHTFGAFPRWWGKTAAKMGERAEQVTGALLQLPSSYHLYVTFDPDPMSSEAEYVLAP